MTVNKRLTMDTVGFIILTWNSQKYIAACLDSILRIKQFNVLISVCDNCSADGTAEILKDYQNKCGEKLAVAYLDRNYGTTVSRNIALRNMAPCDFYCILDSDTELCDEEGFCAMIAFLKNNPAYGMAGPRLVNAQGDMQYSARNIPTLREKFLKVLPFKAARKKAALLEHTDYDKKGDVFAVGYVVSACLLMSAQTYEKVGFLDEKIFYAPDDAEYCMRCWAAGLKVAYFKKCTVLHYWQRISRKKVFSRHNYEHIKGLLHLKRKYGKSLRRLIAEQTR